MGLVARGDVYEAFWSCGYTYGPMTDIAGRFYTKVTGLGLNGNGAGILTVGIGSSADYADEPISWHNFSYTPIGTIQKRLDVLKNRVLFAGDYAFDENLFLSKLGITEQQWKTMETDVYKEPFSGVTIYTSSGNRILRIRTGLSGPGYFGFEGVSFWGLYKTTGYSFSDFIFTVEGLVNTTGNLNNRFTCLS